MADTESKIAYRINQGPPIHFWIPAVGQTMNIMFHSCNGFSLSVNPDDFNGPDPLWRDVLQKHAKKPFHVMIGGGDQSRFSSEAPTPFISLTPSPVYNDAVSKQTVHFRKWIAIKTPFQKSAHDFTGEMSAELEGFYLQRYSLCTMSSSSSPSPPFLSPLLPRSAKTSCRHVVCTGAVWSC